MLIAMTILFVGFAIGLEHAKKESGELIDSSPDSKIDSILVNRDSILERVDTLYIELENNNKQYEKDLDIIINNSPSADLSFFKDYLDANRARLDSLCNSSRY